MLPTLSRQEAPNRLGESLKLYQPPKELAENVFSRKESIRDDSKSKPKMAAGFKPKTRDELRRKSAQIINQASLQRPVIYAQPHDASAAAKEIRIIEMKIKYCERKIKEEKQKKLLQEQRSPSSEQLQNNFLHLIREHQMQEQQNRFDYLTNPGQQPKELPLEPSVPAAVEELKQYSINEGVERLQKFYEGSLKKKFQRREVLPHQPCKRKTPKLSITLKQNALLKSGKPKSQEEHLFRILTKEVTPQQIYPTIPSFNVIKDNLSKNIVAYLAQYKPFIEKTKEREKEREKEKDISIEKEKGSSSFEIGKNKNQTNTQIKVKQNKNMQIVIFE